jgi:hypothetical protein
MQQNNAGSLTLAPFEIVKRYIAYIDAPALRFMLGTGIRSQRQGDFSKGLSSGHRRLA